MANISESKTELGALFAEASELLLRHSDPTLLALGELLGKVSGVIESAATAPAAPEVKPS